METANVAAQANRNAAVAMARYYARQFDAAIAQAQTTIDMEPFYPAYLFLGLACQQAGRGSEAIAALEHASRLSQRSTMTMAALGAALAADGRTSEATSILMITAGMPPLMSMLNSERWLCIEARLFSQKRFTRCFRQ